MQFEEFPKMARLSREIIITEKIDGTNGQIAIDDNGEFFIGSRTRWLTPETGDNHDFMAWALYNKDELMKLGPGRHFGEWWGSGIQRGYGLPKGEKRFSLFNTHRWSDDAIRPACCHVVPVLERGLFDTETILLALNTLEDEGSKAAPGFMQPEGIVVFHSAANFGFKKTIKKDEMPKSFVAKAQA